MRGRDGAQPSSGGTTPPTPRGMPGEDVSVPDMPSANGSHWGMTGGHASGPDMHDLSVQVAKVRAKTRPWKSIIALVLAIAAAAASGWARSQFPHFFSGTGVIKQVIAAATAVAFCVFASAATIGLSGKARQVLQPVIGTSHSAVVRYALVLIGAVTTLIVTLVLFDVPVGQLLLGGALTSVFVGIAAQQALSNVFAGLVLLLARPFKVGDSIRLRAGALSGEIGGTVSEIGITYVRLATADGMVSVPNSQVLNAVVGPLPPGTRLPPPPSPPPATAAAGPAPASPPPAGASPASPSPAGASHGDPSPGGSVDGAAAGPVGTTDGAAGAHRPGTGGEQ
jgi:Mechanosensitive ion channel, beta-domain